MSTPLRFWLLCLLPGLATSGLAGDWTIDHGASRLVFMATWEGTPFEGVFRRFDARMRFDKARGTGRFDVTVDVTSADLDSEDLYEGMGGQEWFHFTRFPKARFVTSAIRPLGGERYEARGTLTLKGVSREIAFPFTWTESHGRAHMEGEARLRRTDFRIGTGEWSSGDEIGLEVKVLIDLSLERSGDPP
jgi:polyisoprenoid-binding protein YceI